MTYLNNASYIHKGEITVNEPVDGPEGDHKTYEPGEKEPVYDLFAARPSFSNGDKQFYEGFYSHLVYPIEEWNRAIEGEVFVYFDVEKDGSISHFKISPWSSLTPGIDSAIMIASHYLPKMIPGHLKNSPEPVRTMQVTSILFTIKPNTSREDNFITPSTKVALDYNAAAYKPKVKTPNHKFELFQYIVRNSEYIGPPQGTVSIGYTIQVSGEITDVTVLKSLTPAADAEAVRLAKQATVWKSDTTTIPRKEAKRDTLNVYLGNPPGKTKK